MSPTLQQRIARIASPPVDELALKRAAKFGKLNIAPTGFDLCGHIQASTERGDIRRQFAKRVARGGV